MISCSKWSSCSCSKHQSKASDDNVLLTCLSVILFKILKPKYGLSICGLSCISTDLTHVCSGVGNYSSARQDLLSDISDVKTKQNMCPYEAVVSLVEQSYPTKYDRPDSDPAHAPLSTH